MRLCPSLIWRSVPVIVISGAGLLLLSITNRFARVIDHSRMLAESLHTHSDSGALRIRRQLVILARRAGLLRLSIALTTLSLLLAAFLVIVLFVLALMKAETASAVIVLFICCMGALIAGLLFFLADVNISLSALDLETEDDYPRES